MTADGRGDPVDNVLSPVQTDVRRHARNLMVGIEADCVLEICASDGAAIRKEILNRGAEALLPLRPCRKDPGAYDAHLHQTRSAMADLFAKRT